MARLTRRRFVSITAAATALAGRPSRAAELRPELRQWRGIAMGADATITLAHPDPAPIIEAARAEISRLEAIFSLYRNDSALSRLNAEGRLDNPPFELLDCLSWCSTIHTATRGLFDATIQPLWATYAEHHSRGRAPNAAAIAQALTRTGWRNVRYDPTAVTFTEPGMALTLNGIAQGYVADRVASLLQARGLTDILVATGEHRALGGHPAGGDWQVGLAQGDRLLDVTAPLRDAALATSSPLGTTFDAAGRAGHILDPRTGQPAPPTWQLVSITAPAATLADALSTAICLMTRPEIDTTLHQFPQAALVHLSA